MCCCVSLIRWPDQQREHTIVHRGVHLQWEKCTGTTEVVRAICVHCLNTIPSCLCLYRLTQSFWHSTLLNWPFLHPHLLNAKVCYSFNLCKFLFREGNLTRKMHIFCAASCKKILFCFITSTFIFIDLKNQMHHFINRNKTCALLWLSFLCLQLNISYIVINTSAPPFLFTIISIHVKLDKLNTPLLRKWPNERCQGHNSLKKFSFNGQ